MNRLKVPCEIHLHSTHGFFQKVVDNFWLKMWQDNDWKNSKGCEVENRSMYQEIVNFTECGGHTIPYIDTDLGEYKEWLRNETFKKADAYKKELENVGFPE